MNIEITIEIIMYKFKIFLFFRYVRMNERLSVIDKIHKEVSVLIEIFVLFIFNQQSFECLCLE